MRFVHCADLHIDTPFKGITEIHPDLRESLRQSTYQSFENIVQLAISEKVDCVLIAGDIYDSADKSLQAQLKFRKSLQRLSDGGIPAFIVYGNHDPLNSWSARLKWPENVRDFQSNEVQCLPLMKNGEVIAKICGISFAKQDVRENLTLKFKREGIEPIPYIGLLHTNVVGTVTEDEPYAPSTISTLSAGGMDYWALGHVHTRGILQKSDPAIVYPGCAQSTNPKETGAQGCYLVTLEQGFPPDMQFVPTDTIRYKSDTLDVSACSGFDALTLSIRQKCEEISSGMDGRNAMIRLSLAGRTALNTELNKGTTITDLRNDSNEYFEGRNPWIWIEKLALKTAGAYDLNKLRQGDDFAADIISICDEIEKGNDEHLKEMQDELEPLFTVWQGQKHLKELTQPELLEILREARDSILNKIVGSE